MTAKYWIKLYHEILRDPKMCRLSDRLYRRAIELFLLAGETAQDGRLPSVDDMAWELRVDEFDLRNDLADLRDLEIVTGGERVGWFIPGFASSQKRYMTNAMALGMPYHEYLCTPHWQALRDMVLARCKGHCEGCGSVPPSLHVHHLTYERLGEELLGDLTALCPSCHAEVHHA